MKSNFAQVGIIYFSLLLHVLLNTIIKIIDSSARRGCSAGDH